ncbi:uncharacterized protein LOC131079483 [Cryptomeria japonica]|uniref:uncharacterized protein LOC131079483 n=1 Tax=Cryptomeria japonica TaxID=3369 RepID=UPI0027DA4B00|nr:uncharacterized protein LOC131079483 [Cryptomeria japonica]
MVSSILQKRLVVLFTEGLDEPLKGWVKAFDLPTLVDAMKKARSMELAAPKSRFQSKPFSFRKDKKKFSNQPKKFPSRMDDELHQEIRRKNLCYSCKEPWVLGHRCHGKSNARQMEAYSADGSDSENSEQQLDSEGSEYEEAPEGLESDQEDRGIFAQLSSFHKNESFRVRGALGEHQLVALIDTGANHNFIDARIVAKRGLITNDVEDFKVMVVDGSTIGCKRMVSNMSMKLGTKMEDRISKFHSLLNQLAGINEKVKDDDAKEILLNSLPKNMSGVVFRSSKVTISFEGVISTLLDHNGDSESEEVLFVHNKVKKGKFFVIDKFKKQIGFFQFSYTFANCLSEFKFINLNSLLDVLRTFVAPLERLKLEYIVRGAKDNWYKTIHFIWSSEGFTGFWKGNALNLFRMVPFKSINFVTYDMYCNWLLQIPGKEEIINSDRLAAGAVSGIVATMICLPMDTIRTRLVAPGGETLGGVVGCFQHMVRTEGFLSLYKGLSPTLLSMAPAGAVFYGVYDILKAAYLSSPKGQKRLRWLNQDKRERIETLKAEISSKEEEVRDNSKQMELGPVRTLVYGAIAGACAEIVTYPLEVVRRHLQLQETAKLGLVATFNFIVKRDGAGALYAGVFPSTVQVLPSAALSYLIYEFMKVVLKIS